MKIEGQQTRNIGKHCLWKLSQQVTVDGPTHLEAREFGTISRITTIRRTNCDENSIKFLAILQGLEGNKRIEQVNVDGCDAVVRQGTATSKETARWCTAGWLLELLDTRSRIDQESIKERFGGVLETLLDRPW